ncbi:MAG: FAD-binding oxidoreductase [Parcubacteria group bacterium]|nr:FAD-binding oxidoreductase [Parcubacteria group bacterium]
MFDPIALSAELRSILRGEVLTDEASLEHYSTDGSIFRVMPWAAVLPKDATDIVALTRWVREKREKNPEEVRFSLTARGKATDQAGGPLSEGIILRFPGCLDKILEVRPDFVRVEPGAVFGVVNKELEGHGRFLPSFPASHMFSTLGGAVANNGAGEKSTKYGSTHLYIKALKMVLSSGAEVVVQPFKWGDLAFKKQQVNFEGDVYRDIEILIEKRKHLIETTRPKVVKYASGYNIWDVDRKTEEGRIFDLTQLIAGSQGTLGIITEISLWTLPKPSHTGLLLAFFEDLPKSGQATAELLKFGPSALEMVDRFLLELVQKENPDMLAGLLPDRPSPNGSGQVPAVVLLCEFDGEDQSAIQKQLEEAQNVISRLAFSSKISLDPEEQSKFWKVRRSAALVAESAHGKKKALPFIEDAVVPSEQFPEYVTRLYEIMQREELAFSVWGHAGQGNLHVQPFLDVGDPKDREKLFRVSEEVYEVVSRLGGILSGEHNDGIMRTPYLSRVFSPELLKVFRDVKQTFDPLNIFNPGKKVGIDLDFLKAHLREEYDVGPPSKGQSGKAVT